MTSDHDHDELIKDLSSRQRLGRSPKRMADILSRLIAKKGYGQIQSSAAFQDAWKQAVGDLLAGQSHPGNVRRGILDVTVRNSAVAQELQFNKHQIITKLKEFQVDSRIRDIRFRVGTID